MIPRWCLHTVLLMLLMAPLSPAQNGQALDENPARDLPSEVLSNLSLVLFPKIFQDVWRLKDYIRSEDFAHERLHRGDRLSVDAIYARAREFAWDNTCEALLISCMATMDHDRVGVRVPVIRIPLWFTLTSEDEEEYRSRWIALPSRLYADSPPGRAGDRDKLQHFFGSALVAFVSESRQQAERVGDFVEEGEEEFVIGGKADPRDVRANRQGQAFGLRLLQDKGARPSEFLTYVVAGAGLDTAATESLDYRWEHR